MKDSPAPGLAVGHCEVCILYINRTFYILTCRALFLKAWSTDCLQQIAGRLDETHPQAFFPPPPVNQRPSGRLN